MAKSIKRILITDEAKKVIIDKDTNSKKLCRIDLSDAQVLFNFL
jgi:hypothetical protein